MFRVLVSDPIAKEGIARLQAETAHGLVVDIKTGLPKEELLKIIPEYDGLIVRSETKVTEEVLRAGTRLRVVARAGVGIDNVNVDVATERGVIVVNTPGGNTIAVVEHTFLLMLSLVRKVTKADKSVKSGKWERKLFMGVELNGKTLGIVGLGRVGSELARRAKIFGMLPIAYDPFVSHAAAEKLGIEMVSLEEIYMRSDFISVHSSLTPETHRMIGKTAFELMKNGVFIVNAARGGIIDEEALAEALQSGKVAGAGLDVFEEEPVHSDNPLLKEENVVLTPHLGASTQEAQVKVAVDAAESVVAALKGELVPNAVNLPGLSPENLAELKPYMAIAEKLGRLGMALADGEVRKLEVWCKGENNPNNTKILTMAALQGLLSKATDEQAVNLVNARYIAQRQGIEVEEHTQLQEGEFSGRTITLRVQTAVSSSNPLGVRSFEGSIVNGEPRIVRVNDLRVDVSPVGYLLVSRHTDKPGIIGKVGTALGNHNVNIASMEVGRKAVKGEAVMILNVDDFVPQSIIDEISKIDGVDNLRFVNLGD
jgi:D-3-phosphoglycerate dehydrogenase